MLPYFYVIRFITIDFHCCLILLPKRYLVIHLILPLVLKHLIKRKEHWQAFPLAVGQFKLTSSFGSLKFGEILPNKYQIKVNMPNFATTVQELF